MPESVRNTGGGGGGGGGGSSGPSDSRVQMLVRRDYPGVSAQ